MKTILLVISVLLIVLVLLQSNKASDSSQIITGGNSMLMGNAKERGAEKSNYKNNLSFRICIHCNFICCVLFNIVF